MHSRNSWLLVLGAVFFVAQGAWRYSKQANITPVQTRIGVSLQRPYDIRGWQTIADVQNHRESDAFKDLVRGPASQPRYWPGLKAAQVSWVWMQSLSGLHVESSFEGDYSWLFSKLNFLSMAIGKYRDPRVVSLAPFFLVMASDGIGSTLLVEGWIKNYPDFWKTWFFAGYHALENLKTPRLAAEYFQKSLRFQETPDFVLPLVLRLQSDGAIQDKKNRDLLIEGLDSSLRERLRHLKPDWFEN